MHTGKMFLLVKILLELLPCFVHTRRLFCRT